MDWVVWGRDCADLEANIAKGAAEGARRSTTTRRSPPGLRRQTPVPADAPTVNRACALLPPCARGLRGRASYAA